MPAQPRPRTHRLVPALFVIALVGATITALSATNTPLKLNFGVLQAQIQFDASGHLITFGKVAP